jgi:hypothetical protein
MREMERVRGREKERKREKERERERVPVVEDGGRREWERGGT